jgi:hypothetical protein
MRDDQSLISSPHVASRSLSHLDSSTPLEQRLLHHYANFASCLTSCHPSIQSEFNQLLLPMAMSYPPLLSAVMALSAIHRNTLYSYSTPGTSDPAQTAIVSLKTSSISKLRSDLVLPSQSTTREAVLATVLTLCMCEIHSGADQPRSWRLHLEGAREILSTQPNAQLKLDPTGPNALLQRWYTSIEALAALTSKGLNAGQMSPDNRATAMEENVYLDDYFGFSTDLVQAFKEIGAAAWERRSLSSDQEGCLLSEQDLQDEADNLEANINNMILRDVSTPPTFYPGVKERLSDEVAKEFYLCNEAYQHAALIHIYRSIRQLPLTDAKVQHSVKRVLDCVRMIKPRDGLSPYIVLTMPLFTAGKEALESDRDTVREAIARLASELKLKNIWKSLEFLEKYWSCIAGGDILNGKCSKSSGSGVLTCSLEGDDHDFIPY